MATGREDWDQAKASMKRDIKKFATRKWSNFRTPPSSDPSTPALEIEKTVSEQDRKAQGLLESTQQLPPFQYQAIPDKGYIRLLEIVPAPDKERIEVRLSSVSLDESAQTYDALSYVWGDPEQPKRAISVDGRHFEIYESLYDILFSLRPSPDLAATSKVVLWVDAIGINQTDTAERNAQVPIMDSIYRNARRTVVWLGSETSKTQRIFEMLQHLAEDSKTAAIDPSFGDQETLPLALMQFHKVPRVRSAVKELYGGESNIWRILACAWWYRSWTLQEILLSTNITFLMGRYKMDWQDLCTAVDHGFKLRIWSTLEQGTFVNRNILPYFTIKDLQRRLGLYGSTDHGSQTEHGPEILLTLLEGCRQRESKDPRDKIYAVSGILRNIQRLSSPTDAVNQVKIDADYASPVVYVYRMMSQQLILMTKTLDVLGIFPRSSRRGLPSWVTDWSNSSSMAVPLTRDAMDRPRRTHAARGTLATTVRFPEDAVTLVLRGHEVATVTEIAKSIPRYDYSDTTSDEDYDQRVERLQAEVAARGEEVPSDFALKRMALRDFKGELKRIFTEESQHWHVLIQWERFAARREPTNPDGSSTASVYWKTLCAGTYDHADPAATEALYHAWSRSLEVLRKNEWRFGSLGYGVHPLAYILQSSAWDGSGFPEFALYCECAIERRLGWCGNGWLALLPEGARGGDRVVLAEGGGCRSC
ncbi:HET-domain-containing protein [Apiospora phragmitis]|uniref:HET-domain-containing protein n=1 Tax=Apiospora phragmitis TaxID=2905665 RepID=A0ABR1UGT2_9PEZI